MHEAAPESSHLTPLPAPSMQEHGQLSERHLALIAKEVLKMIKCCHDAGLLHGDVKPANFVLKHKTRNPLYTRDPTVLAHSQNWLKSIDFGCSQMLPSGVCVCVCVHVWP